MTSCNLSTFPQAPSLNTITWWVRTSTYEFGGGHSSVHSHTPGTGVSLPYLEEGQDSPASVWSTSAQEACLLIWVGA